MHILKFTQNSEPPESLFVYETIGFNDTLIPSGYYISYSETIGFREVVPGGISEFLLESIGFNDLHIISYDIVLYDTIGFNDGGDESLFVYCEETIGFYDGGNFIDELANSFILRESIGFNDSGFNYITQEHDIVFTWRTRTNSNPTYGYGASEYGAIISYGDGDADNLDSFELHLWKFDGPETNRWLNSDPANEFDDRILIQSIPIIDTGDPDADATYTLTIANNKSLNGGVFLYDIELEVFVKDSDGVYSFPKIIKTDHFAVDHEE